MVSGRGGRVEPANRFQRPDGELTRRGRFAAACLRRDLAATAAVPQHDMKWRHVPAAAPLALDTDLRQLAEEFKLTGGQIANAAMTAASLAASRLEDDSGVGQITMADLQAGARRESQGYAGAEPNTKVGF